MKNYLVVIDAGTTGVKSFVFNKSMEIVAEAYRKLELVFPGHLEIEESASDIFDYSVETMKEAIDKSGVALSDIAAVGIASQRTTWVIWDSISGEPIHNAITWLDGRGILQKQKWVDDDNFSQHFPGVAQRMPASFVPFVIDHLRENNPDFKTKLANPNNLWGNIDTWLLWKLTKGKSFHAVHSTSSVSTIYSVEHGGFVKPFFSYLGLNPDMLASFKEESDQLGVMSEDILGQEIPILSMIADQQSALFSQNCVEANTVKCTNGTGSFVDINVGDVYKRAGYLIPMVAWQLQGKKSFLLEGFSATSGVCLEWLKDSLNLFDSFEEFNRICEETKSKNKVYFIPSFSGFHTGPIVNPGIKGAWHGLSRAVTKGEMLLSVAKSIAYVTSYLIMSAVKEGVPAKVVRISGNVSHNNIICQTVADITGVKVERPKSVEATALGAAELAGIYLDWFEEKDLEKFLIIDSSFEPSENREQVIEDYQEWIEVVK